MKGKASGATEPAMNPITLEVPAPHVTCGDHLLFGGGERGVTINGGSMHPRYVIDPFVVLGGCRSFALCPSSDGW